MNTTKRIEKTIEALEKKQLKNALSLTDREETQRHHQWVEEAARTCLANKGDKERCDRAIKEAKAKIEETVTVPMEDTSLEGLEDYMEETPVQSEPEAQEKSDEELYAECQECHIADAAVKFADISRHCSGEATELESLAAGEDTPPEKWVREMKRIKDTATCGKESYEEVWSELTSYLQERDSPILKGLEEGHGAV